MLKKLMNAGKATTEGVKNAKRRISVGLMALAMMALAAVPSSFAASSDLSTVTTTLTDGAGEMKTNAITIIGVVIGILIVVFGIFWLIGIFRKGMNKAQ